MIIFNRPVRMSGKVDQILTLLNTKAEGRYGLSSVTQKQHALQCLDSMFKRNG